MAYTSRHQLARSTHLPRARGNTAWVTRWRGAPRIFIIFCLRSSNVLCHPWPRGLDRWQRYPLPSLLTFSLERRREHSAKYLPPRFGGMAAGHGARGEASG